MTTNSYLIRGSRVREATSSPFRASDHHHRLAPPFLAVLLVFAPSFIIHIVLALYLLVAPTPSSPSFLTCPTACTAMHLEIVRSRTRIRPNILSPLLLISPHQLTREDPTYNRPSSPDVPRDAQVGRWTLIRPRDSDSIIVSLRFGLPDPRHILPPRSSMVTPLGRPYAPLTSKTTQSLASPQLLLPPPFRRRISPGFHERAGIGEANVILGSFDSNLLRQTFFHPELAPFRLPISSTPAVANASDSNRPYSCHKWPQPRPFRMVAP
ncbi:hypothetical protein BJV77DRAFT_1067487 [Russula vinacea]|nr:hypothetical protein BJV77DRAFT_1067487 [Russula vinacea]